MATESQSVLGSAGGQVYLEQATGSEDCCHGPSSQADTSFHQCATPYRMWSHGAFFQGGGKVVQGPGVGTAPWPSFRFSFPQSTEVGTGGVPCLQSHNIIFRVKWHLVNEAWLMLMYLWELKRYRHSFFSWQILASKVTQDQS